jgi:AcrR family transcriptional regulator
MVNVTTNRFTRRQRERLNRVELILDQAEKLFFEKGFAATTMNDIGGAAEFSRASLYNYFPSKETIYVAILDRAMESLISDAKESVATAREATTRIERLKDAMLAFVRQRQAFFHLYFITRSEVVPNLNGGLAHQLQLKTKQLEGIFHEICREGIEKGELRPCDPVAMGDIFFAQIIGLVMMSKTEELDPPLTTNVERATSFFLDGIKASQKDGSEGLQREE